MAKSVQVLLREDIENLGHCGDVVKVSAGYARNYLMPNRLAQVANDENIKMIARRRERFAALRAEREKEQKAFAERLEGVELTTVENADLQGHLYGSVSAATIVKLLAEQGHEVEERNVRMSGPIKEVGEHEVEVHVYGDLNVAIQLTVEREGGMPEPAPEEPEEDAEEQSKNDGYEMPEESLNQ